MLRTCFSLLFTTAAFLLKASGARIRGRPPHFTLPRAPPFTAISATPQRFASATARSDVRVTTVRGRGTDVARRSVGPTPIYPRHGNWRIAKLDAQELDDATLPSGATGYDQMKSDSINTLTADARGGSRAWASITSSLKLLYILVIAGVGAVAFGYHLRFIRAWRRKMDPSTGKHEPSEGLQQVREQGSMLVAAVGATVEADAFQQPVGWRLGQSPGLPLSSSAAVPRVSLGVSGSPREFSRVLAAAARLQAAKVSQRSGDSEALCFTNAHRKVSSDVCAGSRTCVRAVSSISSVATATEDKLVRSMGGNVSVRAIVATNLVREACARHKTSPISSIALGRALMGNILLANGRDEGEKIQVRISGGGPCGTILTEASSALDCRGFIAEPAAEAATVPELIGVGDTSSMMVTRTHPFWKIPYTGTVQIKSGEIAEDFVQYLAISEQTPASMGLSVELDSTTGEVKHAEGFLVTMLPGWDEVSLSVVENNIATFARKEASSEEGRPEAICKYLTRELDGELQTTEKCRWSCTCSEERLLSAVMMLGETEVQKIIRDNEPVDATCDWCRGSLSLTPEQIREHVESDVGRTEVISGSSSPRGLKIEEDEQKDKPTKGTADWS